MLRNRGFAAAALALGLGLFIAGCGGGATPPPVDVGAEKAAIRAVMASWEGALEAYNVDQMVSPLTADFTLTIQEGNAAPYTKDRAKLMGELQANQVNQRAMRNAGYRIDIKFAEQQLDVAGDGTTGSLKYGFTTDETVGSTPAGTIIHEAGNMEATLVKSAGRWQFKTMKLRFNPVQ